MFGLLEGLSGTHFGALNSELWSAHAHVSHFTVYVLGADSAEGRCCMRRMGGYCHRWLGFDKVCDSFTVSLTIPQKLYSEVPVFAPANHRDFHGYGSWFLLNSNPQCEIGSCVQCDVAAHSTAGR